METIKQKCKICGELLPIDIFTKEKKSKTGYSKRCKPCYNKYSSERLLNDPQKAEERRISKNENYHKNNQTNPVSLEKNRARKRRSYKKRSEDSLKRLQDRIRGLIRNCMNKKGFDKSETTLKILGTDWESFMSYMEDRFTDEMTWENQGSYWEIDHILPNNTAKTKEDVIRLNHYTNLQPLSIKENRSKKDKITPMGMIKEQFPYEEIKII